MANKNDMKKGLDDLLASSNRKTKPVAKSEQKDEAVEQFESIKIERNPIRRGRPSKNEREALISPMKRTSLMLHKDLYSKAMTIASQNSLNISDILNASLRLYIKMYEKKHGEITPRESNISADSLI